MLTLNNTGESDIEKPHEETWMGQKALGHKGLGGGGALRGM